MLVPGTVTVLVPYGIVRSEDAATLPLGVLRIVGAQLMVLGAWVYLRCAWDFAVVGRGTPAPLDPPRELVARGLYRYVRNPMYLGVLSVVVGEALFFESVRLLQYAAVLAAGFHLFVVLYEEPALRRQFGESYGRYLETVPRWTPRRPRENSSRGDGPS
ncbi:MAG: isoprenylcysteine carboxylmethyltransferase family protein [Thermoanaerobaculia bacterium]|nr:isoprenylcysteine carboxylmethyltransferase family protein [Thermoanaerobaculia bacterium]